MDLVLEVNDLIKKYGELIAVNKISLNIEKGEIFGLLGPNGAGKTTVVEMIEGLRKPDSGTIKICGMERPEGTDKIKEIMGVQLQSTTIYEKIRIREVIDLFGGYYKRSLATHDILEKVSLNDKKDSFVGTLSGGQKQRVALALALVNDPEVIFMDEPTTGLDPQARRNVWDVIESLQDKKKTIILTTHYMEEAERLCDRVGIMDHGKIIAMDKPKDLIDRQNLESAVEFMCSKKGEEIIMKNIPQESRISKDGNTFIIHTREASSVLSKITRLSEENNFDLENISVRRATLEDVFLSLTGRNLRN